MISKPIFALDKFFILNSLGYDAERRIMESYFPEVVVIRRKRYINPFRADKTPKCYFNYWNNKLYFIDNSKSRFYDCFDIVMLVMNCNFKDALKHIIDRFQITGSSEYYRNNTININNKNVTVNTKTKFDITTRKFNNQDRHYWTYRYGIQESTLSLYNVKAVKKSAICTKGNIDFFTIYQYKAGDKDTQYCYLCYDDKGNQLGLKLYRPYAKEHKHLTNIGNSKFTFFGINILPKEKKPNSIAIITSSLKGAVCIYECGYDAYAGQSESNLNEDFINLIKSKYSKVFILFDRDITGLKYSTLYATKHKLGLLILPKIKKFEGNDFPDYQEKYGIDFMYNLLNDLIKNDISYS